MCVGRDRKPLRASERHRRNKRHQRNKRHHRSKRHHRNFGRTRQQTRRESACCSSQRLGIYSFVPQKSTASFRLLLVSGSFRGRGASDLESIVQISGIQFYILGHTSAWGLCRLVYLHTIMSTSICNNVYIYIQKLPYLS